MKTNAPLNVGLLGFGYASATFHAPLIAAVPGLRLAAIFSSRPQKVQAAWPSVAVHSTAEALITHPDLDVVVIATPNDTHAALATHALAAGKHVVVDKPFTLTMPEARSLVTLAQEQQRVLSVFHNRRWDADFITLRSVLRKGVLGRVTHFESHFDRFRPQVRTRWRESGHAGSGLWYDLGPHLLDQTLQLFGRPQSLWLDKASQREGSQTDDWFHAVLRYDEMRVVLHASALTAQLAPRFVVHGTQGSLTKHGLDTQEDSLKAGLRPPCPDWGLDPQDMLLCLPGERGELDEIPLPCKRGDYLAFYTQLRDAVMLDAPNPVPPEEALQVMELIALGLQSAQQGRVLPVPKQATADTLLTN